MSEEIRSTKRALSVTNLRTGILETPGNVATLRAHGDPGAHGEDRLGVDLAHRAGGREDQAADGRGARRRGGGLARRHPRRRLLPPPVRSPLRPRRAGGPPPTRG